MNALCNVITACAHCSLYFPFSSSFLFSFPSPVFLSPSTLSFLLTFPRMRQVQQELFVNFAVQLFLEGQETELGRTTQQLGALYLADEKCSLMEECLRTFTEAIQEEPTWSCESHGWHRECYQHLHHTHNTHIHTPHTSTHHTHPHTTHTAWTDMEQVVNCLEDHLFAHVYDHVFHPNGDSDMMRDQ